MKKIKMTLFVVMIVLAFIFSGELYIYKLDSFQHDYIVSTFSVDNRIEIKEVTKDFLNAAKDYDLGIFTTSYEVISENKKAINIYGNQKALDELREKEFSATSFNSLIVGEVDIKLYRLEDMKSYESLDSVYFTDSSEMLPKAREFKAELVDKYGGGFPKDYGKSKSLLYNQIFIWGIVFLIYTLVTAYEIKFKKKENFIRMIHGENITLFNVKNYLLDQILIFILIVLTYLLISQIYYLNFTISYILYLVSLQAVITLMMYYSSSRINLKKDSVGIKNSNSLLYNTYIIKIITLIIALNLLMNNFNILVERYNYKSQEPFFKGIDGYNYYQLNYRIENKKYRMEDSDNVHASFYDKFSKESLLMINMTDFYQGPDDLEGHSPVVLLNQNALEYQLEKNGLTFPIIKDGEILILTNKNEINAKDQEYIDEVLRLMYPKNISIKYEIYNEDINIVAINDVESYIKSSVFKNPIIILELTNKIELNSYIKSVRLYYAYGILYDIDRKDFNTFILENDLENEIVGVTNAYDLYKTQLMNLDRSAMLVTGLSALILILEVLIILLIVQLEYIINKKELALKKVLGYSFLEKNKKIIITQLLATIVSIIIAIVFNIYNRNYNISSILIISSLVFVLELLIIVYSTRRNENMMISNTLKGAS